MRSQGTLVQAEMEHAGLPLRCQSCRLGRASEPRACPFHELRRPAGTVLARQDERSPVVFYLRRGQVVLSNLGESGTDLACSVRGPDSLLAAEALVGEPVRYQISALSEVVLCAIEVQAFRDWVGGLCSPMGSVLELVLRESGRYVVERQGLEGPAVRRVARYLINRNPSQLEQPTPNSVLAHVLGMRPETLSRALAQLRKARALAPGRTIRVLDSERLRVFARE